MVARNSQAGALLCQKREPAVWIAKARPQAGSKEAEVARSGRLGRVALHQREQRRDIWVGAEQLARDPPL